MEHLIKNALVDGQLQDILVRDGVIEHVGKVDRDGDFDAEGNVTVPGLVDCHLHLDKCLLNEMAPYADVTGPEKGAMTRELKANFTVPDITARAERMLRRALNAGAVAVRTNVDVDGIVGLKGMEALLALREKYRGTLDVQVTAFAQEGIFADGKTHELLREAVDMGADLVGGHTIAAGEGTRAIDFVLELAAEKDLEAEFHLDESGNRKDYLLPYLTDRMKEMGMQGRVNGIHMCTLAALNEEELEDALDRMVQVDLKATIAPTAISTRALAPVKRLLHAGLLVGIGSDNIRDFFNPLGSGDVKQAALLLTYVQRFFTAEQVEAVFGMITGKGAQLLGLKQYGIRPGYPANLTVLEGKNSYEVLAAGARLRWLMRSGQLIAVQ